MWHDNQFTKSQVYDHQVATMTGTSLFTAGNQAVFHAIVTDFSRIYVRDKSEFSLENLLLALESFDSEILSVMLLILLFNLVMPIISTCLDKSSFSAVKN